MTAATGRGVMGGSGVAKRGLLADGPVKRREPELDVLVTLDGVAYIAAVVDWDMSVAWHRCGMV